MPGITVRRLLSERSLLLRLVTPESAALEKELGWVHNSDLANPAPFLSAGDALLTTGAQFAIGMTDGYHSYVARLVGVGVPALGLGIDVVHHRIPPELVTACTSADLPLFEVPFPTPFVAVSRAAANLIVNQRHARDTWTLNAQREISRAALHADGVSSTLDKLSRLLRHWVALFDINGQLNRVFPREALAGELLALAEKEVRRLIQNGKRASTRVAFLGEQVAFQTVGARDQLRGVLAFGESEKPGLGTETVITSVIALMELALERDHVLDQVRSHFRTGLLNMLIAGNFPLVESTSQQIWGPLPKEKIHVAALEVAANRLDAITEALEQRAEAHGEAMFYARDGEVVIVCVSERSRPLVNELCLAYGARCGVSNPALYRDFGCAVSQAIQALKRADENSVVDFADLIAKGMLAYLAQTDSRDVAKSMLARIVAHDSETGTELLLSLRTWLQYNAQLNPAAQQLGIHRHTLRARISRAELLLQRDLTTFDARADLWAAITVLQDAGLPPLTPPKNH